MGIKGTSSSLCLCTSLPLLCHLVLGLSVTVFTLFFCKCLNLPLFASLAAVERVTDPVSGGFTGEIILHSADYKTLLLTFSLPTLKHELNIQPVGRRKTLLSGAESDISVWTFFSPYLQRSPSFLSLCLFLSLSTMCTLSVSLSVCESKVLSGHFVSEISLSVHPSCLSLSERKLCVSQRYQISPSRQTHQLKYVCRCSC